jgi:hypothetical protein
MPTSSQAGAPSWKSGTPSLYAPTISSALTQLFSWGPLQFQIQPFNIHEYDHETASDWAHKDIAGAPTYREWVGENDEIITFRGRVFPYRIGGMGTLEMWEAKRLAGSADLLTRGDGTIMGWFVCEKLIRAHTYLSSEGIGQQIAFETSLARVPVPGADGYINSIFQTTGAAGAG